MIYVISKFIIANGLTEEVKSAFKKRPHLVDEALGFIRMDVVSPIENLDEIWLITCWDNIASYETWHRSEAHHHSHSLIPKGLKLIRGETEIRVFEHVAS